MKEGWTYKKLGEIATEMYRGSGIKRDQITTSGFPCIRYGEIYTTFNIAFEKCVSHTIEESISPRRYFEHGDLLFAITGESVEDIGKTVAYLGHEKCLLGGDIVCMKHKENPKFLAYALSSKEAIRQKGLGKTKLKVVHTNIPSLQEIVIPVPSLSEQLSIVARLDAAFANIDALKANAEKQLTEARQLFQAELTECMRSKEGWEEVPFKKICDFVRGPFGGSLKKECFKPSGYAVYEQQNAIYDKFTFRYYIDEEKYNSMKRFSVEVGDLIMSCSGTIGKVAVIPQDAPQGIINQALLKLSPNQNLIDIHYLKQLMESKFFGEIIESYSDGAAIKNIASVAILKEIVLRIPPIEVQHQIVTRLDALSAHVRQLEEVQRKTLAECDALKQAMLREMFE